MRKMLKEGGQIFIATAPDNFLRHSYIKQNKEGIWDKYLPGRQPFVDYTDNPEEHFKKLLQSVGFQIDLFQSDTDYYSVDHCKGSSFKSIYFIYIGFQTTHPKLLSGVLFHLD